MERLGTGVNGYVVLWGTAASVSVGIPVVDMELLFGMRVLDDVDVFLILFSSSHLSWDLLRAFMKKLPTVLNSSPNC